MLKVADLQQFIDGLAQPMKSAGANQKAVDDLLRMSQGLEFFKERTIGEFNEFLQTAHNYVTDGTLPEPGRRSRRASTPKAPLISVADAAQRVMALYERGAADPNLDYAVIEAELKTLEPMTVPQLKQLAEQVNMTLPPNTRTKQDLLKAMATGIKERKLSADRPLNMQPIGEPMPVGSSHPGNA
jgi:hypothetical protein